MEKKKTHLVENKETYIYLGLFRTIIWKIQILVVSKMCSKVLQNGLCKVLRVGDENFITSFVRYYNWCWQNEMFC